MENNTRSEPPLRSRDLFTRLLRVRPLLLGAVLFLLGCILQYEFSPPRLLPCLALLLLLLAGLCLHRRRQLLVALLVLALLPAGMLRFHAAWDAANPLPEQREVSLFGRICEPPEFNAENQRTICILEDVHINGAAERGRIRLYLRGDEAALRSVQIGQQIQLRARLWQADGANNPGQFNAENYYRAHGMRNYATADIGDAQLAGTPPQLRDLPKRLRAAIGERIDRLFPESAPLAHALILGDRSELSEDDRESYARAGVAHLLAISGMHISVLSFLILLLLGRFMKREHAFWLTLMLLLAYCSLIGFTPSLTRALIMFAVLGFAPSLGRYSDAPTRLAAALLLHLAISPLALLDSAFVLSYGAVAGLLLLTEPLSKLPLLRLAEVKPGDAHKPFKRLLQYLLGLVTATLAVQLAILPAEVHFFGVQPLWSLLTNLLAAPLTMFSYALALLVTLLNSPLLAHVPDTLFAFLTKFVRSIASLPLAELRVARFPLWLTLLCILLCVAASPLSRLPGRLRRWLPFALLLAIPLSNLCAWTSTLGVSVMFLDAEQADCAVIRCEGHVYLVDTGDSYSPVGDYLSAMHYSPDAVFLTHPHADHAGGLADVLEQCVPARVYLPVNWDNYEIDPTLAETLLAAREAGSEIVYLQAGEALPLSEHVSMEILAPRPGSGPTSPNEDSLILCLEYGTTRALFLADASTETTTGLAGDIDLLKVAHHGARNGTDAALLAETTPSVAVISVGRNNNYGHPAHQTLELLEAVDAQVLRTDRDGAVCCRLQEDGTVSVRKYLSEGAHG